MSDRLAELADRREQALHAGSERSVERQHAKGKMLARERLEYLLDEGSFHEPTCSPVTVHTTPT